MRVEFKIFINNPLRIIEEDLRLEQQNPKAKPLITITPQQPNLPDKESLIITKIIAIEISHWQIVKQIETTNATVDSILIASPQEKMIVNNIISIIPPLENSY